MDTLWRLIWALPVTVLIGGGLILLLKQFLGQGKFTGRAPQRMVKRESLSVSDNTQIHLVEVDGRPYMLVESTRSASLHNTPAMPHPAGLRAGGAVVPWLRGLRKGVWQ